MKDIHKAYIPLNEQTLDTCKAYGKTIEVAEIGETLWRAIRYDNRKTCEVL